jgi:hypothetical protein
MANNRELSQFANVVGYDSGNVGINRTDPNQRLNVSGNIEVNAYDNTGGSGGYNTSSGLIIGNLYDAGKSYTGSDDRTACVWQERGLDLDFATNDTLRMKLTYDGSVGIGTNNPQHPVHLHNAGSSNVFTTRIQQESSNTPTDGGALLELGGTRSDGTYGFYGGIKGGRRNSAADNKGYLAFFSDNNDGQSLAERMRLDDSGRLLVGTTSADSNTRLHVSAAENTSDPMATDASIVIANTQNVGNNEAAALKFNVGNTNTASISAHYDSFNAGVNSSLRFYTQYQSAFNNPAERLRITSDGKVHIGDSLGNDHSGMFQVIHEGGGNQTNDCLAFFETNANDWVLMLNSNEGGSAAHYHIYFMEEGTTRGQIAGSHGQNVNYTQGSDYRWKENIIDLTGTEGIDICKRLRPRKYNWIKNREGTGQINTVDGFIAHEVQEAGVLGAVIGEKDAVNEDGSINGQMLDYGQMTPVLAAAIKGLIAKVETLEAQVAALENP